MSAIVGGVRDRWDRIGPVTAMAVAVMVVLLPWLGLPVDWQRQLVLVGILALTVSGLNLSMGYAGELALGQAVMYAAGAYVSAYLALRGVTDIVVALAAGIAAAVLVGLLAGIAGLRLGGWTLGLASFLLVGLTPRFVNIFPEQLGGFQGLSGIPAATIVGLELDRTAFYVMVMACVGVWFAFLRNTIRSREGLTYLVLKESPMLARSLGVGVSITKARTYALGAVPAGVAGVLYTFLDGYVNPAAFGFDLTLVVLAASILGGARSVYGAVLGAALLQLGPRELAVFDDYSAIAYGVLLVAGGVLLRSGFAGIGLWVVRRASGREHSGQTTPADGPLELEHAREGAPVEVCGVVMRFGGFTAVDGVSFTAERGRVTGLIGPNGSGKTTLLNVVTGLLTPTEGEVRVGGVRVSGRGPRSARLGVARTFQTPLIPDSLTVREVALTGRLAHGRPTVLEAAFRLPRQVRTNRIDRRIAGDALDAVGLGELADTRAATLSLGPRRLLELARALAAGPSVVLLDEIASGLDESELVALGQILRRVRDAGITLILVEHNIEFVRSLSDHVIVLADGVVIARGRAEDVVADPEVVRRYLGSDLMADGAAEGERR